MGVGWYCSGRQANFLREIVLEGQKQLRGLLQSVPAAAQLIYTGSSTQLIYRQQPSWFWPSGRQAPPVWVKLSRVASSSLQSGKIASKHIALTRSRILRRSNLLHLKGPAGATCLAECPKSFFAQMASCRKCTMYTQPYNSCLVNL